LPLIYVVTGDAQGALLQALRRLGRASLFIYWIHVELVYGYASWLWRQRLPVWATALACAAFCVLMYGVVVLRDRVSARAERRVSVAATA
jgi:predicted membrane metal-binding protein